MRTLYFDCFAGVSGNMILGALVALGVDRDELIRQLTTLAPVEIDVDFTTVDRSGISSIHAQVRVPDEKHHRHLSDIKRIIEDSGVSQSVKDRSTAIFQRLAEAEAKVHGTTVERIHFHEVGAMDAIVDIVGACIGFEMLRIERFACSKIHVGSGFVEMAHGKFPVPPPAVSELLQGFPYYSSDIAGELATPTGVAIVATTCGSYDSATEIAPEATGYGAGTRQYDGFPNVLRLIVGERTSATAKDRLIQLETNIDDLSPQVLGYVMDRAFAMGALDCWFTPIQMKKNRPAVMLSVLCERRTQQELAELIYRETSTLGIRVREVDRECLEREVVTVDTDYGRVDVKIARLGTEVVNAMPEYEQVRQIAIDRGVAYRVVHEAALAAVSKSQERRGQAANTNG